MTSIQSRLGTSISLLLIVLFLLQLIIVSFAIRHLTEEFVVTRLKHDAESLLAEVQINSKGWPEVNVSRLSDAYMRPFSGHYYHIDVDGKDAHSRSLWDFELNFANVPEGEAEVQYATGPLQQPLMVYVAAFHKQGKTIMITTAHEITDLNSDIRQMQLAYGGVSLLALVILLIIQRQTLRWGLRPAEKAREQLQAMGKGEIKHLNEEAPTEIQPLVQEINRLVDLLSQRLQRSRNSLGNLAHALKTPLTVMNRLTTDQRLQNTELQSELNQQIHLMHALVERELKRARLAGAGGASQRFNPKDDSEALVDIMKKVYAEKSLDYVLDVKIVKPCVLDREDMLELLGNLLDNASKWAKHTVHICLLCNDSLIIDVQDDGPGVTEEDRQRLMQRGTRVDESTAGHGLGLAIVSDAVEHYAGSMQLGRSESLGGLSVYVEIPMA